MRANANDGRPPTAEALAVAQRAPEELQRCIPVGWPGIPNCSAQHGPAYQIYMDGSFHCMICDPSTVHRLCARISPGYITQT